MIIIDYMNLHNSTVVLSHRARYERTTDGDSTHQKERESQLWLVSPSTDLYQELEPIVCHSSTDIEQPRRRQQK